MFKSDFKMCGIAGVVQISKRQAYLQNLATRMANRLRHRGPDSLGTWSEDGIAFAHRRLAIVDLSEAGAQPMESHCGRFVLAFNGEIYNHLDLRRHLSEAGTALSWHGYSDTETLLAAISHRGLEEALSRSAGVFALALWDRSTRRLTLARDRLGEKPLYWGWAGGALLFGSEQKALRAYPACPSEICPDALAAYLSRGYVPAPLSIHPGLYKLEPGCLLEVAIDAIPSTPPSRPLRPEESHGGLSIRRHCSLDAAIETGLSAPFTSDAEAIAATEVALSEVVGRQMVANVPLGAFLSGGIDSSLIVALMQAQSSHPIKTFTVGFETKDLDESPFAEAVARHLHTDHTTLARCRLPQVSTMLPTEGKQTLQ